MKTEVITENIEIAAELIRSGGLVAVPTETVYGLAGNGLDADAVQRIYEVKGRPEVKALSLMVPDAAAMARYCSDVPPAAYALAERFWPGPLTIILNSKCTEPPIVRAGGTTIGLRCPDHPLTLALLRAADVPLAAPSANPSGAPSPKTAATVLEYFDGQIEAVIDGGACGIGQESTILDMSHVPYRILRQGALPKEEICAVLRSKLKLIGITGGSGCGKTTALNVLRERGALVIDCDAVYHELTVSDAQMRSALIEHFGDVYDGTVLNRKKLGGIVFSNPAALKDLNRITHGCVDREVERLLCEHAMNGGTLAAIDAIGLLEATFATKTDINVAVTAPTEARIVRLVKREGISEEYARSRIEAQHTNEYFSEHCDHTLHNEGTQAEFEQICQKFFTEVLNHD